MTSAVESRLEKLTIQHSSVTDILKGFNKDALTSIIATEGPTQDAQGKPFKPSQMRSQIRRQVTIIAARTLAESLSLEELKGALKNLNIDHEKVGNNPNSKRVHIKRFEEQMHEHGIEAFLSEKVDADVQVSFCAALGLKPASTSNAEVLAKQIANYLEYQAITAYFEAFDVHFLHDLAFDNKLEKEVEETSSKAVLIEALFTGNRVATVEAERPKQQKTVKSKKQPAKPKAIAQGVTYDALFQHYGVDELREWARENGLIVSGSKPDLINRILAFLDGDKENTTADGREAQRKAKSEEKKKAKAAKAAKEAKTKPATAEKKQRKTVKETKPAPKEEEVEEDEEEEEEVVEETKPEPTKAAAQPTTTETKDEEEVEDEEEAEGLDLDNLKQYSRADLVKYCEEEEIAFKTGAKKGELIEAILKYNEEQEE